jgi:D-glycero-D-manno-heptose 1,7-bisphosphate phosphatase
MVLKALSEWPVDRDKSILIGDYPSDIEAGRGAGVRGYLMQNGDNLLDVVRRHIKVHAGTLPASKTR